MKKRWIRLAVAGVAAIAVPLMRSRRARAALPQRLRTAQQAGHLVAQPDRDVILRRYLMYVMLPLWFVPGILDYVWHKRTRIETTSGLQESVIHSLMMSEVGVAILAGLLFEINAAVLGLMLLALAAHTATAIWDVSFASERRLVKPGEQHTHSMLEMLPFCAVSFSICLHWDQFAAMLGVGPTPADFRLRRKDHPLPAGYVSIILGLVAIFVALPYGEEFLRCFRARQEGLVGRDSPECARELFGPNTLFT